MITITIFQKPDGRYKGVQVIGHADSVAEGADLVCCAVSVLTINLANSLEKFTEDDFEVTREDGLGLIQITFSGTPGREAKLLLDSFCLGAEAVAGQYGTWLKVITREV